MAAAAADVVVERGGGVLSELMADDLVGLGVTSIGHRRKLLAAISALRPGAPPSVTRTAPAAAPASSEAERRQLTAMFCDLIEPLAALRLEPPDPLERRLGKQPAFGEDACEVRRNG